MHPLSAAIAFVPLSPTLSPRYAGGAREKPPVTVLRCASTACSAAQPAAFPVPTGPDDGCLLFGLLTAGVSIQMYSHESPRWLPASQPLPRGLHTPNCAKMAHLGLLPG